jgi:hypothetical protein
MRKEWFFRPPNAAEPQGMRRLWMKFRSRVAKAGFIA